MPLRKSPQLTPELLAAARQNAQHSTGPRRAAAKQSSKLNALKHGQRARPENHHEVMLCWAKTRKNSGLFTRVGWAGERG